MNSSTQKIVLLGEGCVGKTSIVNRYINNTFDDNHVSTLQGAFFEKNINVDKTRLKLSIWDTAGQERFHALGPIYYRDSKGAILVYDITDKDSFQRVRNWVVELRRVLGEECVLVLVGNKIDLERDRKVSEQEAIEYSKSVGAIHLQASAKLNKGIQELFFNLAKILVKKLEQSSTGPHSNQTNSHTVTIVEDDKPSSKGYCC